MGEMRIGGTSGLCGVIGDPIAHTLSPLIHNTLSRELGTDSVYVPLHVTSDNLREAVAGAHALGVLGMNVTVPHKQAVMSHLTEIDESAAAIGAVNTMVRTPDGYKGYNTDWLGLKRALSDADITLAGRHAVLLGAGGAAKAAAYLCGHEGARSVVILNRTLTKAKELSAEMQAQFADTAYTAMETGAYDTLTRSDYVCIQTTSVGMQPQTGAAVIEDAAFYEKLSAAFDVVYRPFVTRFMKLAAESGVPACNGLMMLLYQAVAAFELFHNIEVTPEAVAAAKEALQKMWEEA